MGTPGAFHVLAPFTSPLQTVSSEVLVALRVLQGCNCKVVVNDSCCPLQYISFYKYIKSRV